MPNIKELPEEVAVELESIRSRSIDGTLKPVDGFYLHLVVSPIVIRLAYEKVVSNWQDWVWCIRRFLCHILGVAKYQNWSDKTDLWATSIRLGER